MDKGMTDGSGFWKIEEVTYIDLSMWHPVEWEISLLL
jgi:hypothetical protein